MTSHSQEILAKLSDWCINNTLTINDMKTSVVLVTKYDSAIEIKGEGGVDLNNCLPPSTLIAGYDEADMRVYI